MNHLLHKQNNIIYLQERTGYDRPVLLKESAHKQPPRSQLNQLQNEYTITTQLADVSGVRLALAKEGTESQPVLVLDYIQGQSLAELIETDSLDILEKLRIAVDVVEILSGIHSKQVMHKDINSSNILVAHDPSSQDWRPSKNGGERKLGGVYIIDFGLASTSQQEISSPLMTDNTLFGTLAYISPEQTGRMNRPVDYRTDFYSLGVTLYHLFTAQLPFQSRDPLEMIHSHIARSPTPPADINTDIPQPISDIILKLMAKNAEERYQTAHGLEVDLQHCQEQFQATGHINSFKLGRDDFSGRLQIPAKLYGRETEIAQLLETLDRTTRGSTELLLVAGYSGVGKTSLIHEIQRPVTEKSAYFVEGKFDQYQRATPYSAWGQAFQALVNRWLNESQTKINAWRDIILEAVGQNGQVLIDLFPNLEHIIGPQNAAPKLNGVETQNRFNYLLRRFIGAVAGPDHPLVVFLDDLQWIDLASLKLLDMLLDDLGSGHFMVIGAYRDNQVNASHPLVLEISHLEEGDCPINQIKLDNLNLEQVNMLLSDSLRTPPDQCLPLARLIHAKTEGNAFFTRQLLHSLADDGLLSFDNKAHHWQWDMNRLEMLTLSENVVDHMVNMIQQIPAVSQQVLQLAACLGTRFDLALLNLVSETSQEKTRLALQASYKAGFIIQVDGFSQFAHDRIQQAAYALIPDQEKPRLHRHIGRILLAETSVQAQGEHLLDIVSHLNVGSGLIEDADERLELAELNAQATEFSLQTTAFAAALDYARTAIDLLDDDGWQSHFDLMLRLHLLVAEAAFLNADYDLSDQTIDTILTSARSDLDKASAYAIRIESYNTQHLLQAAIEAGLYALQELDVPLQETPPSGLTLEVLRDLPVMSDRRGQAATKILAACFHPVYVSRPELLPAIVMTALHLTTTHGLTPAGCLAIVSYATLFVWRDDIEAAYQLGSLGLQLIERLDDKRYLCQVNTVFDAFLLPWKAHLTEVKSHVQATIQIGFETGSKSYLGTSFLTDTCLNAIVDKSLAHAQNAMEGNLRQLEKVRQRYRSYNAYIWTQYVAHLRGTTEESTKFTGPYFVEEVDLPEAMADKLNNTSLAFHSLKSSLHYHLGDYRAAYAHSRQAEPHASPAISNIIQYLFPFYQSLALLQFPKRQTEHFEKLDKNIDKLRLWAEHAPMNCQHKLDLVLAENGRVAGKVGEAIDLYERAINGARQNEFLQDEALANELYGRFWFEHGNNEIAHLYLREAHALYDRWGANAITNYLEEQYPQWLTFDPGEIFQSTESSGSVSQGSLDIQSVLKATETISRESNLEKLLLVMIKIVMENAGAQQAFLIFEDGGNWYIEAHGDLESDEAHILEGIDIHDSDFVSPGIIHYVIRTRQVVLLADAANEGQFVQDPAIYRLQAKSVLCMPLVNQDQLTSIIYLTNNLATNVFTPQRVELLRLLSSQMAISLDRAWLYKNLETQVAERTHELGERVKELDCLYGISRLAGQEDISQEQILEGAVELLPPALHYPEIACARISLDGQEFKTEGFRETPWKLSSPITVLGEPAGQVEVGYLEERGEKDKGPFIEQERVLLNAVAERLGSIIERMRVEKQIQFQAELLETVGQSVIVTDLSGHVVYWNPSAERLYGWSAEEALGRLTAELMVDDYDQQPTQEIRAHFLAGRSWSGEYPVRHRDGTLLSIETTITPVLNTDGELTHIIGVASDIAERKQAEEALQASEKAYRDLVEKINDVIYAVDRDGKITYLNPAIENLIGLTPEGLVGQPFAQFLHPQDLEQVQKNVQKLISGQIPGFAEYRVIHLSGETRWVRTSSQPIRDGEEIVGVQGVLTDITERKLIEEQLEETAKSAERDRLARGLHDSVTQSLYSINLQSDAIKMALSSGNNDKAERRVEILKEIAKEAMAEMRLLIYQLHPSILKEAGLAVALRQRLDAVEVRSGITADLQVEGEQRLPLDIENALFRISLEGLNNVLKHAKASRILIQLSIEPDRCRLSIRDNGIGFDPENIGHYGGYGLRDVRYRLEKINGEMTINSQPGEGTTLEIEVTL